MRQRQLARLLTLLCLAAPLSCSDSLSPGEVPGTYVLRNVAGDPLPAVLYTTEFTKIRVFADTLRFTLNGRGSINTFRESEPVKGDGPTEPFRWQEGFSYRLVDNRIEVTFDCPPNANCLKGPHLVLRESSNGLTAEFAFTYRLPLVYRRVAGAD